MLEIARDHVEVLAFQIAVHIAGIVAKGHVVTHVTTVAKALVMVVNLLIYNIVSEDVCYYAHPQSLNVYK